MKKENITVAYNAERLNAIRLFLSQKSLNFDAEIEIFLDSLFKKVVPIDVRRFLDMKNNNTPGKPISTARKADKRNPQAE